MSPKKSLPLLVLLVSLAAALACGPTPTPGNWYVDTAGDDTNDCQTPATACLTIGAAIGKASGGDIVHVQAGNYVEIDSGDPTIGVVVDKDLTIEGVGDARIDGDGLRTVVSIAPSTSAVMTNLTIHNGGGEATGGIVVGAGSTLSLTDSIVRNNEPSIAAIGPGLYNTGGILNQGTLTMSRVEVIFNNAFEPAGSEAWGGGIHNQGTLTMTDSLVAMNYADNRGAGMYNEAGATATLIDSMVDDNINTGGIWNPHSQQHAREGKHDCWNARWAAITGLCRHRQPWDPGDDRRRGRRQCQLHVLRRDLQSRSRQHGHDQRHDHHREHRQRRGELRHNEPNQCRHRRQHGRWGLQLPDDDNLGKHRA
jgi:hypothetical protein